MIYNNLLANFKIPSLSYHISSEDDFYGILEVAPLEKGYAVTLANSLRRVMLSSLVGFAISGIVIRCYSKDGSLKYVTNMFDFVEGMTEDLVEVVQNLKGVFLYLKDSELRRKIILDFKGKKSWTASVLQVDDDIMIVNPEQRLFTTNEDANFSIEFDITFGQGYVPAEHFQSERLEKGFIGLDAIYSPVKKVAFEIIDHRIEQKMDYEKIILKIWTNGTISPADAIASAAKILKEHFTVFINFDEQLYDEQGNAQLDDENSPEEEKILKLMKIPIEELEFNARAFNCLNAVSIKYVGDIIQKSKEDLEGIKNLGQKSLTEIRQKLNQYSLSFDIKIPQKLIDQFDQFKNSLLKD